MIGRGGICTKSDSWVYDMCIMSYLPRFLCYLAALTTCGSCFPYLGFLRRRKEGRGGEEEILLGSLFRSCRYPLLQGKKWGGGRVRGKNRDERERQASDSRNVN